MWASRVGPQRWLQLRTASRSLPLALSHSDWAARASSRSCKISVSRGFHAVAGVDEVGRGAWFGAVFAGAVILSEDRPVRNLNDSKLLDPERREVLAERIRERAVAWAIGAVDAATIDRVNIYQASRMAMR